MKNIMKMMIAKDIQRRLQELKEENSESCIESVVENSENQRFITSPVQSLRKLYKTLLQDVEDSSATVRISPF